MSSSSSALERSLTYNFQVAPQALLKGAAYIVAFPQQTEFVLNTAPVLAGAQAYPPVLAWRPPVLAWCPPMLLQSTYINNSS